MTTVQSVSTVGNTSDTTAAKSSAAALDYDTFLKLLVAQMKNQDPTKPMDSTEYVAQLATFSQVEQTIQMNSRLDSLLTSSALSLAEGLIGRTVTSPDGSTTGTVVSVRITSDGPIATLDDDSTIAIGDGVVIR
jgi:flagellar basal-body rod modification protein FlgD